jgi:nucleotide-binding universal stress UspA family protein
MNGPVVCGVDFSEDSRRALRWADFMATRLAQPLIVVHAVETLLARAAEVKYGPDAIEATLRPELERFVSQSIGRQPDIQMELGIGEAAGVIRGTSLAADAGLIVLGTQGMGHAGRFWFGSTTTRVLREATRPVLAVPAGDTARAPVDPRVDEIIVGTDFGEAARAAIGLADALSRALEVPVTVLHAVPEVSAPERWSDAGTLVVEEALRIARAEIGPAAPAHWTSDVRTGSASQVLVDAAAGRHALIVVGLSGTAPGPQPGTTAYRVLSGAEVPVLAVPVR